MSRYQVVWWLLEPRMWRIGFTRFNPETYGGWSLIYDWSLHLGPIEIRKRATWRPKW